MDSKNKLTNTNPNEVIVKVDVNGKSDEMDSQNDTNSDRSVKTIDVGVQNDGDSSSKASEERSVQWEGLLKKGVLGKQDLGSRECLEVWTEQERGHRKSFMEEESAKEKTRLILLKQCSAILKQGEERFTKESLHRAFQDEDLLERIFRLFDTDQKQYLVQEDWIEYLKGRLTEPKQLDFIEQVESVAYVLVGSGDVTLFTFNHILQNKVVTNKLFRVVDTDGDGYSSADEVMEFLSVVSSSRPRVGFNQQSVDQLEQLFRQTVGDEKEITREQFKKIVVSKNPFFTERVFQIFDEDDSGAISLQEFIAAVNKFAGQTPDDKIRFLFQVYDLDGDGLIQHRELQHVMRACMEENGMEFSDDQLLELTSAMFEDADPQRRGAITFEALRGLLCRHDGLLENLTISIDRWLVPPKQRPEPTSLRHRISKLKPYQLSLPYVRNNYVYLGYLAVFFLVNIGLFVSRAIEYRKHNGLVIIARACGQCLNFNCSWLLVLMLRQCITQLRVRGLNCVLPLDHHIYLHKLTGVLVAVYSVVHTLMHLCNFSIIVVNDPVVNAKNYTLNEWLLTTRPGLFGLLPGCANPTGVALCLLLVVVCGCSQPAIRRGGCFEIFYWTHLLYVPFWVLLLFHGPNFWKWFVLPGTVYVIERILRIVWVRSGHGKSYISSGILLPSRVTHLEVKRPPHFEFRAGDYVFVNIPAIATYEWHPFTISSAPEQTGHIWLHIRGVGEWTNHLYEYFEEEHERLNSGDQAKGQSAKARRKSSINKRRGSGGTRRSADLSPAICIDEEKPYDGQAITPIQDKTLLAKLRFEKSFSMPDVMRNQKKKQRMYALHEYKRAESETSLDQLAGSKPPPPRPALANNFRYLRRKPAIVTLTTPSLDERRRSNDSIITIARRRLSKSLSPDKDVELVSDNPDANATSPSDSPNDTMENYPIGKPLEIYLDGPYGAASSHIFGAQHAALVAAGIGVTPFASILQALMRRHWAARAVCPRCDHAFHTANPTDGTTLKKVDFFWINREQRSFEWFVSLLSQLEMEQAELGGERFLEMHMYITSALQRTDMKAVGLQLALDLLHEKEKRDLITGLKTRTNAGRPNWDKVFKQLQEQNKGKVTVFYCGPPQLARVLRVKCDQFGFHFRKEVF